MSLTAAAPRTGKKMPDDPFEDFFAASLPASASKSLQQQESHNFSSPGPSSGQADPFLAMSAGSGASAPADANWDPFAEFDKNATQNIGTLSLTSTPATNATPQVNNNGYATAFTPPSAGFDPFGGDDMFGDADPAQIPTSQPKKSQSTGAMDLFSGLQKSGMDLFNMASDPLPLGNDGSHFPVAAQAGENNVKEEDFFDQDDMPPPVSFSSDSVCPPCNPFCAAGSGLNLIVFWSQKIVPLCA